MKLVQKSLMPLSLAVCGLWAALSTAAQEPDHLSHYNPAKGFKPAQANLTEVFLQIAGSLEHDGSPEPYLRHVVDENLRISAKYRQAKDKEMASCLPDYMTEEHVQKLAANWNKLSPKLKLDELARNAGEAMRLAIKGLNGETALVLLLNHHQELMIDNDDLDDLHNDLIKIRDAGEASLMASREAKLSQGEQSLFKTMLEKPRFTKADFQTLDRFYKDGGAYDRLSESGRKMVSVRVWAGTKGGTIPTVDAQQNLKRASGLFSELYGKLEKGGTSTDALAEFKTWLEAVAVTVGRAAQAEIRLAVIERSL